MSNSFYFWLTMAGVSWIGFMVDRHWTGSLLFYFLFCLGVAGRKIFKKAVK